MIDQTQPGSPGWWFNRLAKRLEDKRSDYDLLESYYDGTQAIPVSANKQVSEAYRRLMSFSRTNFAELVVEAVRERMQPVGFRTGAAGDAFGDKDAWGIWQANSLDADNALVHTGSLSMGMGYVMVGPVDPEIEAPLITPEDPREVIVETDPRRRRKVIGALKTYRDDVSNTDVAFVWLEGQTWRAERAATETQSTDLADWEWTAALRTTGPIPVVPFPNRPRLGQLATKAEFETHLSLLDRINYTVLQRVEIATMQAFRQRALKGGPVRDENGEEIDYDDIFAADPGAIWHIGDTQEIWESGQVNLDPIRSAIRDDIRDLAAVTRTPLYYFSSDAQNGSAEGASLSREGLIFKTKDRLKEAGEAWEQVMAHAFRFAGDEQRANRRAMEIIWAPAERMSLAEMADGGTKALTGGLTLRKVRERVWGATPQEIEDMEQEDRETALREQGAAMVNEVVNGAQRASRESPAR